jgi:heme A synthase
MEQGLHHHGRANRETFQILIEQAFRTVSALTIVIVLLAAVYAAFYMFSG